MSQDTLPRCGPTGARGVRPPYLQKSLKLTVTFLKLVKNLWNWQWILCEAPRPLSPDPGSATNCPNECQGKQPRTDPGSATNCPNECQGKQPRTDPGSATNRRNECQGKQPRTDPGSATNCPNECQGKQPRTVSYTNNVACILSSTLSPISS
jgi:hypothetical protein